MRIGDDNQDHTKLRTYKMFKSSFTIEPYINLVRNRNQRKSLSRFRLSAHNLDIERLRYQNVPLNKRLCRYCCDISPNDEQNIDDEISFFSMQKVLR